MVSNPFIHIRVIQCYNWRIYELSNSKSNYHSDTSYEPQSTGQQGLLQALLQAGVVSAVSAQLRTPKMLTWDP